MVSDRAGTDCVRSREIPQNTMSHSTTTEPPDKTAEAVYERRAVALTQAVDDYHTYLLEYLHGLTRQRQDAENLLQDLWRHVLLNFDEAHITSLPLLRRKAYQLFVDHYRRNVRRGEILSDDMPEVSVQPDSFTAFTEDEEAILRIRFWSEYPNIELTEQQKDVLWMSARYGFTYKEIEAKTGIASSTVGDWIAIARTKLTEAMNNEAHL